MKPKKELNNGFETVYIFEQKCRSCKKIKKCSYMTYFCRKCEDEITGKKITQKDL